MIPTTYSFATEPLGFFNPFALYESILLLVCCASCVFVTLQRALCPRFERTFVHILAVLSSLALPWAFWQFFLTIQSPNPNFYYMPVIPPGNFQSDVVAIYSVEPFVQEYALLIIGTFGFWVLLHFFASRFCKSARFSFSVTRVIWVFTVTILMGFVIRPEPVLVSWMNPI